MSVLPNLTYSFSIIPVKIPVSYLVGIDKTDSKGYTEERQKIQDS